MCLQSSPSLPFLYRNFSTSPLFSAAVNPTENKSSQHAPFHSQRQFEPTDSNSPVQTHSKFVSQRQRLLSHSSAPSPTCQCLCHRSCHRLFIIWTLPRQPRQPRSSTARQSRHPFEQSQRSYFDPRIAVLDNFKAGSIGSEHTSHTRLVVLLRLPNVFCLALRLRFCMQRSPELVRQFWNHASQIINNVALATQLEFGLDFHSVNRSSVQIINHHQSSFSPQPQYLSHSTWTSGPSISSSPTQHNTQDRAPGLRCF